MMVTKTAQPAPPAIVIETDEALDDVWSLHLSATANARTAGEQADLHEQNADRRRAEADAKRAEAARLIDAAGKLEADAKGDDHNALILRGDQAHHQKRARDHYNAAGHLAQMNGKTHPGERLEQRQRDAAANAGALSALDMPLNQLVSPAADVSQTAPHHAQVSR